MRKLSKIMLVASLSAFAVPALPALAAQDAPAAAPGGLTPEQQSAMQAWPEDTKAFYASLSPEQQKLFWRLSDEDKVKLSRMDPAQRDETMRQLLARSASAPGKDV